jgi:tetratricopeptide (TPR) repeat protein
MRDAKAVLEAALATGDCDPVWSERIGLELANCGEISHALLVATRLGNPQLHTRILASAADHAVRQFPHGRSLLPEAHQPAYDLIVQAFRQLEAGQDDSVRETLQGIGLQSPFLEWKLMMRGLQAYYQNEDARAVENWQRLNTERLPSQLIAPLRFQVDANFRLAQQPEVQGILQKEADRFQESGLVPLLRAVQKALADTEALAQAFRKAETLLDRLRQQGPQLVPRLASCFYWTIVAHGQPEDLRRYERVFGKPPEDPNFDRLQALVNEQQGDLKQANKHWQAFEKFVAETPPVWPPKVGQHARSLIWCRMGRNASSVPGEEMDALLPPFLRDHPSRPRPLKPSAEECFRHSIELTPNLLEPYQALLEYYERLNKDKQADKAARQLLQQFPEHVPTLEALAQLRNKQGDHGEAITLYERALKINPLDRDLRNKLGSAHLFHARTFAEAAQFDEARAEYQEALRWQEGHDDATVYCKWAACEFKAGDAARGEELLAKALSEAGNTLAVDFSMLIEIIRLKLPRALKTRFDKQFNAGLKEPPSGQTAAALAETAASHIAANVTYLGQKTHEKKVLTYLDKALRADFTEDQLRRVCVALVHLQPDKLLRKYAVLGLHRFSENPYFPYFEAESYITKGPFECPAPTVLGLLNKARELAARQPPSDQRNALLALIEERQQIVGPGMALFGPQGMGMMEQLFEMFGDEEFDDDDDDDDFDDRF